MQEWGVMVGNLGGVKVQDWGLILGEGCLNDVRVRR